MKRHRYQSKMNISDTVHQYVIENISKSKISRNVRMIRESPHKLHSLRSKSQQFDDQTKCFLCGEPAKYDKKSKKKGYEV